MSANHTYAEIAADFTLWVEYVDPDATMPESEFDAMSVDEKIRLQQEAFGVVEVEQVTLHGRPVDYDAAVNLMDDEIRERLHNSMAPCSDQEFLDAYVAAHAEAFDGEEFRVE